MHNTELQISQDWIELLSTLNKYDLDYLILGGLAVNLYGYYRYTKDIDIFVGQSDKDLAKLKLVFKDFFGTDFGLSSEQIKSKTVWMFGKEPNRIDFLINPEGITFTSCFNNKSSFKYLDQEYNLISKEDLIKNKLAVGRPQDLADVAKLEI